MEEDYLCGLWVLCLLAFIWSSCRKKDVQQRSERNVYEKGRKEYRREGIGISRKKQKLCESKLKKMNEWTLLLQRVSRCNGHPDLFLIEVAQNYCGVHLGTLDAVFLFLMEVTQLKLLYCRRYKIWGVVSGTLDTLILLLIHVTQNYCNFKGIKLVELIWARWAPSFCSWWR
jgi:hypothetical protein